MRSASTFQESAAEPRIYSADGATFGLKTGGARRCQMEGCRGESIAVRWQDGKLTYPCTMGLTGHPTGASQIVGGF